MPSTRSHFNNCAKVSCFSLISTSILLLVVKKMSLSEAEIVWAFCSICCIPFISWRNNNGIGDGQTEPTQPESQPLAQQLGQGAAEEEEGEPAADHERELRVIRRV